MELQLSAITERLESQNLQPFEFEQSSLLRTRTLLACWQLRWLVCAAELCRNLRINYPGSSLAAQYDAVPKIRAAITAFVQL
jgi:hypothetical protein